MSQSGRKHGSKWDRMVDRSPENLPDSAWSSKRESSIHEKEAAAWHPPHDAGNSARSKLQKNDIDMPPRELLSGRRDFQRDENRNEKFMFALERDRKYTTRMSPGFDEWRQRDRSRSPKSSRVRSRRSRSRSQSHSPVRKVRRESGFDDRSRNRLGTSSQLCRDFAAGRCRRADHCPFLHNESENYDRRHVENDLVDELDSRYRKSGASRYLSDDSRDNAANGRSGQYCEEVKGKFNRGSSGSRKGHLDEAYKDGDIERRSRGTFSTRIHDDHEPSRGFAAPCRFYVQGNCRNGKNCRYSHHLQEVVSSEKRSLNKIQASNHELSSARQVWDDSESNDLTIAGDGPSVEGWPEDENMIKDVVERDTTWPGDGTSNPDFGNGAFTLGAVTADESVVSNEKHSTHWRTGETALNMDASESKSVAKCVSDAEMHYVKCLVSERTGEISHNSESVSTPQTSFPSREQGVARDTLSASENQYASGTAQPKAFNDSYLNQNSTFVDSVASVYPSEEKNASVKIGSLHPNLNVSTNILLGQGAGEGFSAHLISGINATGQGQPTVQPSGEVTRMPHNLFLENKFTNGPHTGDANVAQPAPALAPIQSTTHNEHLLVASNLPTTVTKLLENKQQLSQLYAALAPRAAMETVSSFIDSVLSVPPNSAASFQPNGGDDYKKQYDPICDSIEPKTLTAVTPDLPLQKNSFHEMSNISSSATIQDSSVTAATTDGDLLKVATSVNELLNHQSHGPNQGPVTVAKIEENAVTIDEGTGKPQNQPVEDLAIDGGADDDKKVKDVKGIRPFKFALAEFVKELLKPTWKEGQVSKEVYKTIVKKVVEKVTDTFQGANVPQTKEKIDHYLSFSRPKLSKLVQAYVEKYQKS